MKYGTYTGLKFKPKNQTKSSGLGSLSDPALDGLDLGLENFIGQLGLELTSSVQVQARALTSSAQVQAMSSLLP